MQHHYQLQTFLFAEDIEFSKSNWQNNWFEYLLCRHNWDHYRHPIDFNWIQILSPSPHDFNEILTFIWFMNTQFQNTELSSSKVDEIFRSTLFIFEFTTSNATLHQSSTVNKILTFIWFMNTHFQNTAIVEGRWDFPKHPLFLNARSQTLHFSRHRSSLRWNQHGQQASGKGCAVGNIAGVECETIPAQCAKPDPRSGSHPYETAILKVIWSRCSIWRL